MKYVPLHCHSHFSLLDGLSKPEDMAERVQEIGASSCAITDHGSISGAVQIMKEFQKNGVKPILGCEMYICEQHASLQEKENRGLSHLCVLAKNKKGWKKLINATSDSNKPENFYHKPRLALEQLADYVDGSLVGFSGHLGSTLANEIIYKDEFSVDWEKRGTKMALLLQDIFGKGNFFLEVQLMMQDERQRKLTEMVRDISRKTGIPCISTPDAHYAKKEDAEDQQILLCSNLHKTMTEIRDPTFGMSGFVNCHNFHIPSAQELMDWGHTEEELANTLVVDGMIEEYTILSKPILPDFPCPDGHNPDSYLKQLCRDGWTRLVKDRIDKSKHGEYADRVKMEMEVLQGAGLSSYFLIVRDIMDFVSRKGWLPGPGRGSAAGCLVSYLLGITQIDPMPYGLLFERFYNAGRNTEDRVSMPDIDMDVPALKRDEIIDYIRDTYGKDRVSQMITYQTMQGRSAIKSVFRAHADIPFEEMNEITKSVPDKAKIAGDLQTMKEATGESSIIRWALAHEANKLSEWARLEDDGTITGPYASRFAQAIRLEGTKTSQSTHAAGVVIAPEPLNEICPMVLDKDTKKRLLAGMEMNDLEDMGFIKFDVLALQTLDKVMGIQGVLETGDVK